MKSGPLFMLKMFVVTSLVFLIGGITQAAAEVPSWRYGEWIDEPAYYYNNIYSYDYQSYLGEINAPWSPASLSTGINVSGPWPYGNEETIPYWPKYEDGWRLYVRRLFCGDINASPNCASSTNYQNPYYVLYNIHTGVLRLFWYISEADYQGAETIKITMSALDFEGNSSDVVGFFLDKAEISLTQADKNPETNQALNEGCQRQPESSLKTAP